MKQVKGIILIISCQKYKETRLKEYKLKNTNYDGWEVIYVIGDLFLNEKYILNDNILYINTEDSYIHLLKKLTLAIKYLNDIFIIEEGILKCGDDLIWNEDKLLTFLASKKYDYYGQSPNQKNINYTDLNQLKKTTNSTWISDYYKNHPEDFDNPYHNLKNIKIPNYVKIPNIHGASGVIFYLSNKACKILVDHMENINYNVLAFDSFTECYPYTIDDIGVSFIMYMNYIPFIHNSNMYDDFNDTNNAIVVHTNKYK